MQNLKPLACSVWAVRGGGVRKFGCTSHMRRKFCTAYFHFSIIIANVAGKSHSHEWSRSIPLSKPDVLIYCDVYFRDFGRICNNVARIHDVLFMKRVNSSLYAIPPILWCR